MFWLILAIHNDYPSIAPTSKYEPSSTKRFSLETSLSDDRSDLEDDADSSWRSKVACWRISTDWRLLVLSLRLARTEGRQRDEEVLLELLLLATSLLSSWDEPEEDDELEVEARRLSRGCLITGSSSSLSLLQRLDDNWNDKKVFRYARPELLSWSNYFPQLLCLFFLFVIRAFESRLFLPLLRHDAV